MDEDRLDNTARVDRWLLKGLAAIAVIVVGGVIWSEARAHINVNTGIAYPPSCCNSAATTPYGDCAPISSRYVTAGPDGYHIDLPVGAHPKLKTKGYRGVVPYGQERAPLDHEYHICLSTDGQTRYCFFPLPFGS
jgi:hypothetical protein